MTEYITGETRPTDCFIELFSETVLNYLVDSVNSYAEIKMQQNKPAKWVSLYQNWKPVTPANILKYIALAIIEYMFGLSWKFKTVWV